MTAALPRFVTLHNGLPATAEALASVSFAGYAHFTALQVRDGRVRGIDLHLARLRAASIALFGRALADEQVLAQLRLAIEQGPADLSLMATVYSAEGEFTRAPVESDVQLLVRTAPASNGPDGPLRLGTVEHERVLPRIKHVGEIAKTHFLRQAIEQGFDDVAFVDHQGRLSEGSIWNLAFWDGENVIWPQAPMLGGTTMAIVRRQLTQMGVPQEDRELRITDLPTLKGAVVMNSWTPGIAVGQVAEVVLPDAPAFLRLLHQAFAAEPAVRL